MEIRSELKDFILRYYCDKCQHALVSTGKMVFQQNDTGGKHVHKCPNCELVMCLNKKYPYTITRETPINVK